ncbi:Fructosamine/Ketosamine-3-kinase [Xylariomycetidae sp. FL0641]|nr:Fructosamine/Ketosamine-3-kinase [Xylariomycetidae sp. FL0641]
MSSEAVAKGVAEAREVDPVGENVVLDENLMAALPEGSQVLRVTPSGASAWVKTLKIDVRLIDGTVKSYFKKGAPGNRGFAMMEGTYESEKLVHVFIPEHVPEPLAWGTYKSMPDMHFYMCDFVPMSDDLPDPAKFGSTLAQLHLNSMGKSPTGQYGFHTTTHLAFVPNDNSWTSTWTEWFANAMGRMFREEEKSHGTDEELDHLKKGLLEKVVPRLLRPLETGGRRIQPSLCHSDVWPGNVKPRTEDGKVMMFDSCAFWGHYESDLGCCKAPRYGLGRAYVDAFFQHIPVSEPAEDFDDRLALYAMRYDLLHSALFPKETKFRETAMAEMRRLVTKYPEGF